MKDNHIDRIKRTSKKLRLLFTWLIAGVPIINLLYWLNFNSLPKGFVSELPVVVTQPLSFTTLVLAFLVSLIPICVALFGINTLRQLFKLYESAIIFSVENVKYFHRLGYTLISWVVASTVFTILISVVLTFNNPPGSREIVAQFGTSDLTFLAIGVVVVLISWVMEEGYTLKTELKHTV